MFSKYTIFRSEKFLLATVFLLEMLLFRKFSVIWPKSGHIVDRTSLKNDSEGENVFDKKHEYLQKTAKSIEFLHSRNIAEISIICQKYFHFSVPQFDQKTRFWRL